jgi:hypothetical protein
MATLRAGCPATPLGTCYTAGKGKVMFKGSAEPAKQQLKWKWGNGTAALMQSDFGNPVVDTTYTLCVYDHSAGVPAFKTGIAVAPAGLCGGVPCWSPVGTKGWKYRNSAGNADAVTQIILLGGVAGKPKLQLKAKGAALPLPAPFSGSAFFDEDPSVILQLHSSSPAACWGSTFEVSGTKKNTATQFKAKTP